MAYRVRAVLWPEASEVLVAIRTTVFVEEQGVPVEIERDGRDGDCVHVLAESSTGEGIGTGRLLPDGRIGRMAVLKDWRGHGVGAAILLALMDEARGKGHASARLFAQLPVKAFYERYGFTAEGEQSIVAGIPHVWMRAFLK